jgi:hypothetical protein
MGTPLGSGNGFPSVDSTLNNNIATWSGSETDYTTYFYYDSLGGGTRHTASVKVPNGESYITKTATYYDGAESSDQNMAVYAKNNNIKLYTISFAGNLDTDVVNAMKTMAESTGGFYEHAPDAARLAEIYTRIAGDLRTEAGVDTTAVLDFGMVTLNNESVIGSDVFTYVPDPPAQPHKSPGSTFIHMYNKSGEMFQDTINQLPEWDASKTLSFNIGTVNLNETWEATFRLKVIREGNINIFGPDSYIRFTDSKNTGIDTLVLPPTFITASKNLTLTGMTMKSVILHNLICTEPGEIKNFLPVQWNTNYTGVATVEEQVYYSIDGGQWVLIEGKSGILPGETTQYSQLDVTKLPVGSYLIKVAATAPDAPDAEKILETAVTVGGRGKAFIKLE